jgi:opacity protein-like surface antigen
MKTKTFAVLTMILLLGLSSFAQENEKRFGIELNGGTSFATKKIENADLNIGYGFEGMLHYRFMPYTGIYAGWGWNKFGADESFAGKDVSFEETGYIVGLQFKYPVNNSPFSVFLRGAGLYNHVEIENADGDILKDSGHGFGWQAAAGLDINLGKGWSLAPGVKFNYLPADADYEGVNRKLDMNYFNARVGIIKMF